MPDHTTDKLDVAVLLPGVGVFGGVRRFIEIGNEMVRRGHRYTLYDPDGAPPQWTEYLGDSARLDQLRDHQVLIANDPPLIDTFDNANARLKMFYFALENVRGERDIATRRDWVIMANSSGMYERLRRKYGVSVERVIGGIDLDVFNPQAQAPAGVEDDDSLRILTFGRVSRKKKGVDRVVRAAESFARKYKGRPVKLVLFDHIGPGNERDPRDGFRCGIPYEFHLNLTQAQLAGLYTTADVFVSAEKRAGWANTVAEAMACGVPVVCTRSGTLDLARHRETAWVVRYRQPFFLRRGLRALIAEPELASNLRAGGLEHVRRFSWPHVTDQLEAVIRARLT